MKWTIIIQISGENNLIMESISVFNEICSIGSTGDVNFVILMDGMNIEGEVDKEYKYLNNEALAFPAVYLAKKATNYENAKPEKVFKKSDNLADKKNLATILAFIKNKYPAEKYGYIYKGHGGSGSGDVSAGSFISAVVKLKKEEYKADGTVDIAKVETRIVENPLKPPEWTFAETYFLNDNEKHPSSVLAIYSKERGEVLTYAALCAVLKSVFDEKGLSFILLDCCWGMMLENVYLFSCATQYFIASADESPALGVGYTELCELITKRAKIKPAELARLIVAVYYTVRYSDYDDPAATEATFKNMGVSFTCVDTEAWTKNILPVFTEFCTEIINDISAFSPVLLASINTCKDYTYSNPLVYKVFNIDLIWLLENIIFQINKSAKPFDKIKYLVFVLIKDIKLLLIDAYLGNNYKKTVPGIKALGGKGITITFPKVPSDYQFSLVKPGSDIEFYTITNWRKMLLHFYDTIQRKEANTMALLKDVSGVKTLANIHNDKSPEMQNLSENIITGFTNRDLNADWYEGLNKLNNIYKADKIHTNPDYQNAVNTQELSAIASKNVYAINIQPQLQLNQKQ